MDKWTYDEIVLLHTKLRDQNIRIQALEQQVKGIAVVEETEEPIAKQLKRLKVPVRGKPRVEAPPKEEQEDEESDIPEDANEEEDWLDEEGEEDDKKK